jgi:D-alanine transaminase
MSRIAYVNGAYVSHHKGQIHIEDRGYQFADGVYEVVCVYKGYFLDEEAHLKRLFSSLGEIKLSLHHSLEALRFIMREIKAQNNLENGLIYIQATRGTAPRYHPFPKTIKPSLVITAKHMLYPGESQPLKGYKVITLPESRWSRCDIKSIGLLPNVLAKQESIEQGYDDAWFMGEEGVITEGTASNAWIVDFKGILRTHPINDNILKGITRTTLLKIAKEHSLPFEEKAFTYEELLGAREAFLSSATTFATPVTHVNGQAIGAGGAGQITLKVRQLYLKNVDKT